MATWSEIFSRMYRSQVLLAVAVLATAGCTSSGPASYTVTGKVTFQNQPVEEGSITFEDAAAGQVNSAQLGPGGRYSVELPAGDFRVSISPPLVETKAGPNSPGDMVPKDVKNIPKRYRVIETSRLAAKVGPSSLTFDFDLTP